MAEHLDTGDEDLFIAMFEGGEESAPMLFGSFLRLKGLIAHEDIFNARMIQKNQNRRIGELAVEHGWLTDEDVDRILVLQEELGGIRFGELAVELGFLLPEQINMLLEHIEESYVFFGEALVQLGAISRARMARELETFHRLKLHASAAES
jgi:hypothetical protein